jgi:precorrin-3B synthase
MSATARTDLRRGACPGLSTPMQTGDGLLARLMPTGTISLDAMEGLAAAALRHGNRIIEITSRGSIQVRGLTPASAPAFADAVAALGIPARDGVPVIADPLAGLDPHQVVDAGALAAALRDAIGTEPLAPLSPKISVTIDGGGQLHLDALPADVRLRAVATPDGPRLHVSIGGDAAGAMPLGTIAPQDAIDTVMRLLGEIAVQGPEARVRGVIRAAAPTAAAAPARPPADPIGPHRLRRSEIAVGLGFPFGHTDTTLLSGVVRAAREVGAIGMRTAPGRAVLVVGLAPSAAEAFTAAAHGLGYITDARDPRRRVIACAGAPICASGEIAARALAPRIAETAAPLLDPDEVIHVSGCAKGCAHHGRAALTVVGRDGACDLLVGGTAAGSCTAELLAQRLADLARRPLPKVRHG